MYNYDVSESTPWADYRGALTEIVFEKGVTSIGDSSFSWCGQLSKLTIPSTVETIGQYAFLGCGLTSVTIPNGVKSIGGCAFMYSENLTTIDIGNSVTLIGGGAFAKCTGIKAVKIPTSVKTIETDAFADCTGLMIVNIPSGVNIIGSGVFRNTDNISIYCFEGSAAHKYAKDNGYTACLLDTPIDQPDFVIPAALTSIEAEAFSGIQAKRIMLGEAVKTIESKAFSGCPNLIQIYIPKSCSNIASDAFANVNGLSIFGAAGSYAETYAKDKGISFVTTKSLSERIQQHILDESKSFIAEFDLNRDGSISSMDYLLANKAGL